MKNIFVVGNWKCNPVDSTEAKRIFEAILKGASKKKGMEVVLCPPFVFLSSLKSKGIKLGAQNCFWEERGAYTGEISVSMLKDAGCQYVIVGHSERRKYQLENDLEINKKIKAVLNQGLTAILCVEKESQIKDDLKGISDFSRLIVAFEPVSAIGTGKAYDVESARKTNLLIRERLKEKIPVLYGGSVNLNNAKDYIDKAGYDGLLIGGVSLKPDEFNKITKILI
ncbi:MAG: triose-phosphate isomerase [Candidatus Nealsonbacteria bacterium]